MATRTVQAESTNDLPNALRSWVMIALTFIFIILYAAALIGWLKPLADEKMIVRLEPVIFVIIGYYFGRLPAQQNESLLKGEINRQSQKADAAQHGKELAQQTAERLEEKIKNVRVTLSATTASATQRGAGEQIPKAGSQYKDEAITNSLAAALKILNS